MMDKGPKKRRQCQWISGVLGSLFWISWSLKMGLIGCPKMLVRNYHSILH